MNKIVLYLKSDKGSTLAHRHPWVFSGALKEATRAPHGAVVQIADASGTILGTGTYSNRGSIAVRVFEFGQATLDKEWFAGRVRSAEERRRLLGLGIPSETNGYRVIFGESDGIPGLVIDRYADVFVLQIGTMGMELLKGELIEALRGLFSPSAIVERSDSGSRLEEGLKEMSTVHHGPDPGFVLFRERGLQFGANVMHGQKTGFYLDQRDLRREITRLAVGRSVLNLFSNTGSFAVAAMKGGATEVTNVDSSESALAKCRQMVELNGLDGKQIQTECADVFQWLGSRTEPEYDMVIVDPPALIKSRRDAEAGRKAYHFLNRAAMRLVRTGGVLVSSSCSNYFAAEDLAFTLRRASVQNRVELQILKYVTQSADHPVSIYFPEAEYLRSYVSLVER